MKRICTNFSRQGFEKRIALTHINWFCSLQPCLRHVHINLYSQCNKFPLAKYYSQSWDASCLGHKGLSKAWVPGQPGLHGPLLHSQPQPRLQVLDAWRVHWPGQGPPQSHLLHQARLPQSVQWLDHQIFLQVRDKLWYYITNTAHTDSLSIYCSLYARSSIIYIWPS